MTKDDVKAMTKAVKPLNQFENNVEIMTITRQHPARRGLLNKTRTTPFVNQEPGEIIWRLEVWQFEKPDETWVKKQGTICSWCCTASGFKRRILTRRR